MSELTSEPERIYTEDEVRRMIIAGRIDEIAEFAGNPDLPHVPDIEAYFIGRTLLLYAQLEVDDE
jgi:hypothetical protein